MLKVFIPKPIPTELSIFLAPISKETTGTCDMMNRFFQLLSELKQSPEDEALRSELILLIGKDLLDTYAKAFEELAK